MAHFPSPYSDQTPKAISKSSKLADPRLALALLVVGVLVGAAVVYLALNLVIEDADNA